MRKTLVIAGVLLATLSAIAFINRAQVRDALHELTKSPTPSPMPYVTPSPATHTPSPTSTASGLPTAVNLDIPFVSQAPYRVWDEDHEEFCEEAASLMVASYIHGDHSVTDPAVAEAALYAAKQWEMTTFGYFKDTTAAETARMIREHFNVAKVQVVANPTEQNIRSWVAQGRAVIVPAAGRELGNPHFKSPGPLYHMVVIKGYTSGGMFITNDAGTRLGADYLYAPSVIMNAMHDWNGGDVYNGNKVVIVVG